MFRIIPISILVVLLVGTTCDSATACPTCKGALHSGLALGYAISILFMMAMPFLIFAFWVVTILRLRANTQTESDPTLH